MSATPTEPPSIDEVLGPPSLREKVLHATAVALAEYDYGSIDMDGISYQRRLLEAEKVIAAAAPLLIEHGREQGRREAEASRAEPG